MVQCFAVFLIVCISGSSLGTTTSPQQQNNAKSKDLIEVRRENYFTFQKKVHNNVAREPPATGLIATIQINVQDLHSYSCAIFNLHKLISYHKNRGSFSIAHFLYHRLLCSYKTIEAAAGSVLAF